MNGETEKYIRDIFWKQYLEESNTRCSNKIKNGDHHHTCILQEGHEGEHQYVVYVGYWDTTVE